MNRISDNMWNKSKKLKNIDMVPMILGILTVLMGYFAWGLWTISYKASLYKHLSLLFTLMTVCLYIALNILIMRCSSKRELSEQMLSVSIIGAALFFILLMTNAKIQIAQKKYYVILIELLWMIALTGGAIYVWYKNQFTIKKHILKKLQSYKYLFFLLITVFIFLIEPDARQFKWDGLLYYLTCGKLDIGSLSSLAVYGHVAQTYGMLNGLGVLITGNVAITMIALNCLFMFFSICAFYGLLKIMIPRRKEWEYVLFTSVYAYSPFLLGMVYYHSLDFLCQCFFPIVLYYLYQNKWIYFAICSLLFCFTKEPAIVIYGMMCVGVVIQDFILDSKRTYWERVRRSLKRKKYYIMIMPGILWIATYKMLGPWSAGEGSFSIDWGYVIEKLKVLYIFNFNWVFSIVLMVGLLFVIISRKHSMWIFIFPVLCSQIGFTIFSCLFKTVNHIRYTDTNQVALYSSGIILLCCFSKIISRSFSIIMGTLLLLSNFFTFDPITKVCFPVYCIGSRQMVTTMDKATPFGDGMIYNRQMLGMERVISYALEDALEEGRVVLFPTLADSTYFFDGMAVVRSFVEDFQIEYEYWNPLKKHREPMLSEGMQRFQVYQLAEDPNWENLEAVIEGEVNLLYMSFAGEQYVEEIQKRYRILEEETYRYRGWEMNRICFEMD